MRLGISYNEAMQVPIELAVEIVKQDREKHLDGWRQTRWMVTAIANMLGSKVKETDLMKLPGDSKTRISKDVLKQLKDNGNSKT